MLQKKYYKLIRVSYADSDLFRITNISDQSGTLTITNGTTQSVLKYSFDGVNFENYDFSTHPTISVLAGANLYMKGALQSLGTYNNPVNFNMDVNHTIGGNILSLKDENNYATIDLGTNYLVKTFMNDTHLIDASDVNFGQATTLGYHSLDSIFQGCSNLIGIPSFSNFTTANQEGAMAGAFMNCTSLTYGADLSNITSNTGANCFHSLYKGCSSLVSAYVPNVNPYSSNNSWLQNVAASGTLYCPSQVIADTIPDNNVAGCPSGWTKVVM